MLRAKFPIDPTQLDKSAAEAFAAHTAKKLSYKDWKVTAATIERLRGIEAFRRQHGEALYAKHHPDHAQRTAELQGLYDQAYPDEPVAT
jgi:hypothetical protein